MLLSLFFLRNYLIYLAKALEKKVKYDKDKDIMSIGDDVLKYFRMRGMDVLKLKGLEVDDYEDDGGAVLEVPDFEAFLL